MSDLEPITRAENFWVNEGDLEPITRKEQYIKHLYDETQVVPEYPKTREEYFINKAGEELHDVTVEQLNVTENGTYSEAGKAYSPVIVEVPEPTLISKSISENGTYQASSDNADGYSQVSVNVEGYKISEVSGLPSPTATFSDGSALPMPNLKIAVEPQQDLHGYDAPWVGGAGKNKLPLSVSEIKSSNGGANSWTNNSKEISGIVYTILTDSDENVIGIKANGTATANSILYLMSTTAPPIQLDGQSVIISMAGFLKGAYKDNSWHDILAPSTETVTLNGDVVQMWGQINNGVQVNNIVIQPMVRLASVTDATFAPYSNICPISGWSAVDVTRTGKNLWSYGDVGGTLSKSVNVDIEAGNYTLSTVVTSSDTDESNSRVIFIYDDDTSMGVNFTRNSRASQAINFAKKVKEAIFYAAEGYIISTGDTFTYTDIQLEYGSTATAYEPYNGSTITIQLGDTYYGGTLDVVSGVLSVTHEYSTFDGSADEGWTVGTNNAHSRGYTYALSDIKPHSANSQPTSAICDKIETGTWESVFNGTLVLGQTGKAIGFGLDSLGITNDTDLNAWLSNNPITIVYELATPTTIQLTPTAVSSLLGQNNLWADTGDVLEASYFESL